MSHVPAVVVTTGPALGDVVALTIEVASAGSAAATRVPVGPASLGAVGPPLVGFDEFEGFIGEVRHGDDAAHFVDAVLRAVDQNGDFIKIADSEAVIESGLPEIENVVTTFHRSEVPVHAVGHCRPEEVGFIHPVRF